MRAALVSLEPSWGAALRGIEFAVADIPEIDLIEKDGVPLAQTFAAEPGTPARVVLYRHPITVRSADGDDVEALVLDLLIEEIAALLGMEPEDVDDRYGESEQ